MIILKNSLMLLIITFIFFTTSAYADTISATTGNTLLEYCQKEVIFMDNDKLDNSGQLAGTSFCNGYTIGILQMEQFLAIVNKENKNHGHIFCIPEEVTVGQIVRVQVKYLKTHPEILNQPAIVLTIQALMKAFPCVEDSNEDDAKD